MTVDFSQAPSTVFDVKRATWSQMRAHVRHELRIGKPKNCDPERKHLNRVLAGEGGNVLHEGRARIKELKARIDKRNTQPFTRLVLGASPQYFRPNNPGQHGAYEKAPTEAWIDASMNWLNRTFGDDLLDVRFHGDEATPHIHAVVLPTYYNKQLKKPQVSHHKHPAFEGRNSTQRLRKSYAKSLEPLGIQYARENLPAEIEAADPTTKSQWATQEAQKAALERIQAKELTTTAKKTVKALEVGTQAVIEEKLEYKPAADDKPEGLKKGKNYPTDPKEGQNLIETIRYAAKAVVSFAKQWAEIAREKARLKKEKLRLEREAVMQADRARNLSALAKKVGIEQDKESKEIAMRSRRNRSGLVR